MAAEVQLHASWLTRLEGEFAKPYFVQLRQFLKKEKQSGIPIFPPGPQIFAALDLTPFEKVKVVILGQDPYHGQGQANGLCFSVNKGISLPPSLKNIFAELHRDLGIKQPSHGDLRHWAEQGVLLLNATLTVRAHQAASHQNQGWEIFTDAVISLLNREKSGLVFLLWGSFARGKKVLIDPAKHCILEAPHPSPLSAYQGFIGCAHFSKCNDYLNASENLPIDWALT